MILTGAQQNTCTLYNPRHCPKEHSIQCQTILCISERGPDFGGGGGWKDNDFKLSTRLILDFLSSQIIQNITGHLSFSKSGNFIELVLGLKFLFSFEAYITQCSAHERHLIKDKFTMKKINLVVFNFLFVSKLLNTSFKQNILRILVLVRDG